MLGLLTLRVINANSLDARLNSIEKVLSLDTARKNTGRFKKTPLRLRLIRSLPLQTITSSCHDQVIQTSSTWKIRAMTFSKTHR